MGGAAAVMARRPLEPYAYITIFLSDSCAICTTNSSRNPGFLDELHKTHRIFL